MDISLIDGIIVFIIESIPKGDMKTGKNLCDEIRQIKYDSKDHILDYQYEEVESNTDLQLSFRKIEEKVASENKIPIIQLECHGSVDGIVLSDRTEISWLDFFDLLRPINIKSRDLLMLHLSSCNGDAIIRGISPTKCSPFRAVIGYVGKAMPEVLQTQWTTYYKSLEHTGGNFCKLAEDNGFIYYNQEFIFDAHFDLANKDPELFDRLWKKDISEMYKSDGPLAMDPLLYKKWIEKKQEKIKQQYRAKFCFEDVILENESIYYSLTHREQET